MTTPVSRPTAEDRSATDPDGLGDRSRRVLGLARASALLLVRNRMTALYALVIPLLPLAMLATAGGAPAEVQLRIVTTALLMALVFPVYYNVLSMVVTRRDELVLKRLRTGEARDLEIVVALALPGVVVAMLTTVAAVAVGLPLGVPFPDNALVLLLGVLLAAATCVALAAWTAAWTRNAEAAQLTSLPVVVLLAVGLMTDAMPDRVAAVAELTPGHAVQELAWVTWFGRGGELSYAQTWTATGEPLLVLLAWGAFAAWLAARYMRWEPRS